MKKNRGGQRRKGITRRQFLETAAAGLALGASGVLLGCEDDEEAGLQPSGDTELRTYYFDLMHADPEMEYHLVAGERVHRLGRMTPERLRAARANSAFLSAVPDEAITHFVEDIEVPARNILLCYVRGVRAGDTSGTWVMPLLFFHLPISSILAVPAREMAYATEALPTAKLQLYGIDPWSPEGRLAAQDPLGDDSFKSVLDQATGLIFQHPESLSLDPDSAAYVQSSLISKQPTTYVLALKIQAQGSATESGGWATLEPYIDPNTNQPYVDDEGNTLYFTRWSDTTLAATGDAVEPSLEAVKNDRSLGANITDLSPDQPNSEVQGKLWKIQDGVPTVTPAMAAPIGADGFEYDFKDISPGAGYKAKVNGSSVTDRTLTIETTNWKVRFLSVYIRYLDANDDPIKRSDLPSETTDYFPDEFQREYDNYAFLLPPEFEVFSIPTEQAKQVFTFNIPEIASSVIVIAGGLGSGSDDYPDTVEVGKVMTIVVNLALPSFFLITMVASAYGQFIEDLGKTPGLLAFLTRALVTDIADIVRSVEFDKPKAFINLAPQIGYYFLSQGITWLTKVGLAKYLTEAQVKKAVPIVGGILQALNAIQVVSSIGQTIDAIRDAPKSFTDKVTLIHDIEVTIKHDPDDPVGFPAVATYYEVTAIFDGGTPHTSGKIQLPGTTVTAPLHYTFSKVPLGGTVKISVGFYSDTDWLAGNGSTGSIENEVDEVEITIQEYKVPLTLETEYHHKQKIALDADGNHVWQASLDDPPLATAGDLSCEPQVGQLCDLAGITVSEEFGAVGYSWKSYSSNLASCESGGLGQLYKFANLSILQRPQNGYALPNCGFSRTPRLVYDLMGRAQKNFYLDTTGGKQIVRQIRLQLDGEPSIDTPDSNLAWGQLRNPSDAFLLHPSNKIVSVSAQFNKIEVLRIRGQAVPDADAPYAVAHSGTGIREGLLDGPVAATITPKGAILVLESKNRRIQSFDIGVNPVPYFKQSAYYVPVYEESGTVYYMDLACEYTGYLYVLSYVIESGVYQYRLDIYTPEGDFLSRTTGVNAARLAVDFWRNVYTLNYEVLRMTNGDPSPLTAPSVSEWIPSTP
jgi:hypothetical protein